MRLYVYYRVHSSDAAGAQAAFEQARHGAAVELLRRPEAVDGQHTWMEVYPESLTPLEPLIASALQPFVVGERHVERFIPLA